MEDFFEECRKRFREETVDIPIANRAFRLRAMNRFVEKAETMKNIGLAMQILEQAAKKPVTSTSTGPGRKKPATNQ